MQKYTTQKVISELNTWYSTNCTHEPPYHLWCKGKNCWEFCGLSSRFTEMHMKGINARGLFYIPCPRDSSDFVGYSQGIMKKHPEWRARLGEMKKYGKEWQRFIKYYEDCEKLVESGKYKSLEEVMSGFRREICKLYYYEFPRDTPGVELKEYLIIGSIIPRYNMDEFDICQQCVLDKFPEYDSLSNDNELIRSKSITYDKCGNKTGWLTCKLYHPNKREETESSERVQRISEIEHNFVDSFNVLTKTYDDKMLELYRKYMKGEIIANEELPDSDKCVNNDKQNDNEKTYENIKKMLLLSSDLLSSDPSQEMLNDTDLCSKNNFMLGSLKWNLKYFIKNNENLTEYQQEVSKFKEQLNRINDLMKIFGEAYLNKFTNEIKLHNDMNQYVKDNHEIFNNTVYHYCPHYILYDEKDSGYNENDFDMCSVQIDDHKNENFGILTCLISISKNHYLHPDNELASYEKEWMNMLWIVSRPIKKCIMYDEGLANADN